MNKSIVINIEAKKYKSAKAFAKNKMVDSSGSSFVYEKSAPNNAYIYVEDGYIIQKGDLVKEYMKGGDFVLAESIDKVNHIVSRHNDYLTITKITKSQLTDIWNKTNACNCPEGVICDKCTTIPTI